MFFKVFFCRVLFFMGYTAMLGISGMVGGLLNAWAGILRLLCSPLLVVVTAHEADSLNPNPKTHTLKPFCPETPDPATMV